MKAQVVSFRCVLKNRLGSVISSTFNHDVLTHLDGEGGEMLRGLAEGLQDLKAGERRTISLPADQAYGFYDPSLVIEVPRGDISQKGALKPGQSVSARAGDGKLRSFRVVEIAADAVVLDGNHPLAGQDLVFDIETVEARDATPEEIADSAPTADGPLLH